MQALHALLGSAADRTRVTLIGSNKDQSGILAKEALDGWAVTHTHRFHVIHTLTRDPIGSSWSGYRGRIDRAFLQQHLPPPSSDVLIFVCGPPSMYEALSGARGDKALSGTLADLGYSAAQVVKL